MVSPVLSAHQLVKRFGSRTAVDGVSFEVRSGEAVGLLGPNGAGKSTTLSLLTGLLVPDSGSVRLQGRELTSDTDPMKRRIGLAPQELALYEDLSAADNLGFFGSLYGLHGAALKRSRIAALNAVGLADRSAEPVRGFSGGMKRRLNLAVALLHEPDLLLLDEPTVGVDPQSRNSLLENIAHLRKQGKTILYTTHYMEEVERLCERVIIIDGGRVLADATVNELKSRAAQRVRIEIGLGESDRDRILTAAKGWAAVSEAELTPTGLQLTLNELGEGTERVIRELNHMKVLFTSIATHQPSLEDIFLELTGKSLRD